MRNTERLGEARQALTVAITLSKESRGDVGFAGRTASKLVFEAELTLRRHDGGRPDLARRLEGVLAGDVTTRDARHELRTVAQKLDAELAPEVSTASFVPASDGGVER